MSGSTKRLILLLILVVGGAAAGFAVALSGNGTRVVELDQEPVRMAASVKETLRGAPAPLPATGACGVELWAIKTLTDPAASSVNLTAKPTTIEALQAAPAPTFSDTRPRSAPIETQLWQLTATLTGYKLEADSDYHLVLSDGSRTMIAEIPDPTCASGSEVLPGIAAARAAFDRDHNIAAQCFGCLNETATIEGVGFFDVLHGQTGVAPNGVELHPVISYSPGGTPLPPVTTTAPPVTTTTVPPTTTTTPSPPPGDDRLDERPGCNLYPDKIYFNHKKQGHCAANYFTTP